MNPLSYYNAALDMATEYGLGLEFIQRQLKYEDDGLSEFMSIEYALEDCEII